MPGILTPYAISRLSTQNSGPVADGIRFSRKTPYPPAADTAGTPVAANGIVERAGEGHRSKRALESGNTRTVVMALPDSLTKRDLEKFKRDFSVMLLCTLCFMDALLLLLLNGQPIR